MIRPAWLLPILLAYGLFVLLLRRGRRWRARARGIAPSTLAALDLRPMVDELRELYEAGLPPGADLALPPKAPWGWIRLEVYRPERLGRADPLLREAAAKVLAGRGAEVRPLIQEGQGAYLSQQLISLALHRLLWATAKGDFDEGLRAAGWLYEWADGHLPRGVDGRARALVLLTKAEAGPKEQRGPLQRDALQALRRAGVGGRFTELGTLAVWAHLRLTRGRGWLLPEWDAYWIERRLKRALAEHQRAPVLYYELAHWALWQGRAGDAVEHLVRGAFYSQGDPFYLEKVLHSPEIQRLRPALYQQVRARFQGPEEEG